MITTKRPGTDDYTQVGFIEAKDGQGNYQNIDHIYDSEGNIVFQQGYLNEYDGADNFRIPAIGKPLIDYTIYGNTFQDGVPTPDNPIMPEGTGERTGNLWDGDYTVAVASVSGNTATLNTASSGRTAIVKCEPNTTYTVKKYSASNRFIIAECDIKPVNGTVMSIIQNDSSISEYTFTTSNTTQYVAIYCSTSSEQAEPQLILNLGSTPLPYEPYGYKIPISSANTTTPVYLGEVQTTRRIRKLVLDGTENWFLSTAQAGRFGLSLRDYLKSNGTITSFCSHYMAIAQKSGGAVPNNSQYFYSGSGAARYLFIADTNCSTAADIKSYLAAQYAAGTPVTVWYVLATEQTAVVNEPLMRIGDYADKLSMEQAGVEIPTLKRPNTTVIDITTSLPPSEVYAKYRGSKTQKYDLFLAANGDSFEAKNGQSLYIGDDT